MSTANAAPSTWAEELAMFEAQLERLLAAPPAAPFRERLARAQASAGLADDALGDPWA